MTRRRRERVRVDRCVAELRHHDFIQLLIDESNAARVEFPTPAFFQMIVALIREGLAAVMPFRGGVNVLEMRAPLRESVLLTESVQEQEQILEQVFVANPANPRVFVQCEIAGVLLVPHLDRVRES